MILVDNAQIENFNIISKQIYGSCKLATFKVGAAARLQQRCEPRGVVGAALLAHLASSRRSDAALGRKEL